MQKLKKTAAIIKPVRSSGSIKNGASRKTTKSKLRVGVGGSAAAKSTTGNSLPRPKVLHITKKATAREIAKTLGIKPEAFNTAQGIIRDLEADDWNIMQAD